MQNYLVFRLSDSADIDIDLSSDFVTAAMLGLHN